MVAAKFSQSTVFPSGVRRRACFGCVSGFSRWAMVDAARLDTYVELHLHSNYSLLEGASHLEELVDRGAALGYHALALTDHDNLYGALTWARVCKERGIQPITGVELTYAENVHEGERYHVTLLAMNRQGYSNLCRLVSIARGHTLTTDKERQQRRRDPCAPLAAIADHAAGLICLTGCRSSEVARHLNAGRQDMAQAVVLRWMSWFGVEDVYVELMDNLVKGDRPRNRRLVAMAQQCGIPVVATGNVH